MIWRPRNPLMRRLTLRNKIKEVWNKKISWKIIGEACVEWPVVSEQLRIKLDEVREKQGIYQNIRMLHRFFSLVDTDLDIILVLCFITMHGETGRSCEKMWLGSTGWLNSLTIGIKNEVTREGKNLVIINNKIIKN